MVCPGAIMTGGLPVTVSRLFGRALPGPHMLLLVFTACYIGLAGVAPHLLYSYGLGDITYYKSSSDEEYFAMYSSLLFGDQGISIWRRSYLFLSLYKISGNNLSSALILSDFIFPVITFFSAYWLSRLFFKGRMALVAAMALLFGQEILSFGSLAIFKDLNFLSISAFRSNLPPWAVQYVPDYTTYYFGLFRTPEPQISWAGLFVSLRLLLSGYLATQNSASGWMRILAAHLMLPFLYTYCMAGVLVFSAVLAAQSFLNKDYRRFLVLVSGQIVAVLVFLTIYTLSQDIIHLQSSLLYLSRLPIIVPSMIYSGALLVGLIWLKKKAAIDNMFFSIGIAAVLTPYLLMNQQLVTRMMISARDWERNINFVFVCIGGLVIVSSLARRFSEKWRHKAVLTLLVAFLLMLAYGQRNVWNMFLYYNEIATASSRALSHVGDIQPEDRIFMEDVTWGNLVEVQMNRRLPLSLNFFDTYLVPAQAPISDGAIKAEYSHFYEKSFFEHARHVDFTPATLEAALEQEVSNGYGLFLGWFFHFRDWWYPSSDNRKLRTNAILEAIPEIKSAYGRYLSAPQTPAGRCWLISQRSPEKLSPSEKLTNTALVKTQGAFAGSPTIYLYRQNNCAK
jgi:hypothetical protein